MTNDQHRKGVFTIPSSETKPSGIQSAFAILVESDTQKVFVTFNNGTAWTQISLSVAQLIGAISVANGGTGVTTLQNNFLQPATKRPYGDWHGRVVSGSNNIGVTGHLVGLHTIVTGTGATHTYTADTTGNHDRISTGTTVNTIVGHRYAAFMIRNYNTWLVAKFNLQQVTNTRFYAGFHSNTGSNPTSTSDPLNTFAGVGLWLDSGASGNWKIGQNNAGAATYTDTGVAALAGEHLLTIKADDTNSKFTLQLETGTDVIPLTNVNTDPPAQTTLMGLYFYIENLLAGTASTADLYSFHTEQDK